MLTIQVCIIAQISHLACICLQFPKQDFKHLTAMYATKEIAFCSSDAKFLFHAYNL